jgi:hypothetical protein
MSSTELKPWQKLRLKDFPDKKSYTKEYNYLKSEGKVAYRRTRYNKSKAEEVIF